MILLQSTTSYASCCCLSELVFTARPCKGTLFLKGDEVKIRHCVLSIILSFYQLMTSFIFTWMAGLNDWSVLFLLLGICPLGILAGHGDFLPITLPLPGLWSWASVFSLSFGDSSSKTTTHPARLCVGKAATQPALSWPSPPWGRRSELPAEAWDPTWNVPLNSPHERHTWSESGLHPQVI